MKTPDEIKKALGYCMLDGVRCPDCVYNEEENCALAVDADAIEYIKQLEAENAKLKTRAPKHTVTEYKIRWVQRANEIFSTYGVSPSSRAIVTRIDRSFTELFKQLLHDMADDGDSDKKLTTVKGLTRNIYEGNPVDGFHCEVCDFQAEDVPRIEYDEEYDDKRYIEFSFRFCPKCGRKVVDAP